MKIPSQKKIVVSSLLLIGAALVAPATRAADEKADTPAERKAHREAEVMKKYDINHDGRLDESEKATKKADKEKAHAEREARKREKEEKKAEHDDR